jgi:hypothetical protein
MSDIDDRLTRDIRCPEPSDPDDAWYGDDPYDDADDEPPHGARWVWSPEKEASLAQSIDAGLHARGCDGTLRAAKAWARRENVRWAWLRRRLEDRGGFCDCEVLLNAELRE